MNTFGVGVRMPAGTDWSKIYHEYDSHQLSDVRSVRPVQANKMSFCTFEQISHVI